MDSRHIDCNDHGVYYVEAKVNDRFYDFLKHPDNKSIHRLLPLDPNSKELLLKNDLAMIQVTVFGCGGISIGLYTSHKIMDGYSIVTFLKSWSATARASVEQIRPTLISSSIFPSNPSLPQDVEDRLFPLLARSNIATRRFSFGASSLEKLKQKAESSRVLAVTGLIWKCAFSAFKARSTPISDTPTCSTLTLAVNLRDRISPPFPPHSIGNVVSFTTPVQCSEIDDLGLNSTVQRLKNCADQFFSEIVEKKIKDILLSVEETFNEMKMWYSDKNSKHMVVTSICRSGTYEVDFGWGNPIWVSVGNGDSLPAIHNFVTLLDTRCGNGIEVWVTLREEDMAIFERDPELLAFASLNASPLEPVE